MEVPQQHTTNAFGLEKSKSLPVLASDIVDLTLGEPHLSVFPAHFLEQISRIPNVNRYYPAQGSIQLRQALIDKFYQGLQLSEICITHGAIGALDLIVRSMTVAGDEILLPDPGFPPYEKLAQFARLNILRYRLTSGLNVHYTIHWDDLERSITEKTKLIFLNSPSNPTGQLFTCWDKLKLNELLNKYPNLHFVMDEVYREMIFEGEHIETHDLIQRGFVVGSFSKMYPLQGGRIGWLASSENLQRKITPYLSFAFGAISSFGQELALKFLKNSPSYSQHYQHNLNISLPILDEWHVQYTKPQGGFFFWIHTYELGTVTANNLAALGVKVVAGESFGPSGKNRVRVCFSQDPQTLKKGLTILGRYLKAASC